MEVRDGLCPLAVHGRPVRLVDQAGHLGAVDDLVVEQGAGDGVEAAAVLAQHLHGPLLLGAQDPLDLVVDDLGRVLGVVARVHEVLAQEDLPLRAPGHRPDGLAHAPLAHHLAGQLRVADQVVGGARGEVAVDEELGAAAAHAHAQRVLDVLAGVDVALLHRELVGDAERHARREDGDLVHGVGVLEHVGQHGVAALVVRDALLLGLREDHRLAPLAHQHPVARGLEVVHGDLQAAPAHGVQRRLVDQVGQVGAAHARACRAPRRRGRRRPPSACPCSAPGGSGGAPRGRAAAPRSGGRSGRAAAARGRGCRAGWSRRS